MFKNIFIYLQFIDFLIKKLYIYAELHLFNIFDTNVWFFLTCAKMSFVYHILELLHCCCSQIVVLLVVYFLFNLEEINFVWWLTFGQTAKWRFKWAENQLVICLRNTLCSETLWNTLKAQIYKKNVVSKSIVHVIKHANFQRHRVHPDKVI